jgi:hypothetical protein
MWRLSINVGTRPGDINTIVRAEASPLQVSAEARERRRMPRLSPISDRVDDGCTDASKEVEAVLNDAATIVAEAHGARQEGS